MQASRHGNLPLDGVAFSGASRDIVYGSGRQITAYSISRGTRTTVLDVDALVPGYQGYQYAVSVSADDTKFAVSFGGIQDEYRYLAWYDRESKIAKVLDLPANRLLVNGEPKPIDIAFAPGAGIHSQDIDRSGRFVSFTGPGIPGHNAVFWDTENDTFTPQTARWSGHAVLGYGVQVNQSGSRIGNTSDGRGFTLRSLTHPNDGLVQLLYPPPPPPYNWSIDGHISWGNVTPDNDSPVVGSTFIDRRKVSDWAWPDGEIIAIATDGSGDVWRFAHNRAIYDGNFWDSPRGNASPDGRWYIFTSNWDRTLGSNASGFRRDVFLVELALPNPRFVQPGPTRPGRKGTE
jgi:hypothetical protein